MPCRVLSQAKLQSPACHDQVHHAAPARQIGQRLNAVAMVEIAKTPPSVQVHHAAPARQIAQRRSAVAMAEILKIPLSVRIHHAAQALAANDLDRERVRLVRQTAADHRAVLVLQVGPARPAAAALKSPEAAAPASRAEEIRG